MAAELGLPPGATAVFGLCVGYPAPDGGAVKPRLPQSAVLHHERYDPEADMRALPGYDAALEDFSRGQERSPYTWTQRAMARWGTLRAMVGRDRLREALGRLGFPLR